MGLQRHGLRKLRCWCPLFGADTTRVSFKRTLNCWDDWAVIVICGVVAVGSAVGRAT